MLELKVKAQMENLYLVQDKLEVWLNENKCSIKTIMQINIAAEEVFANIVHYAYNSLAGDVIIKCEIIERDAEKVISISFLDSGRKYNPLENKEPDINLSSEEREIGGLGILMVKRIMDNVDYYYRDNFNVLTIQKNIDIN